MNRRVFLGASALAAAGCRPRPAPALRADRGERERFIASLAAHRVPKGSTRTTPHAHADLLQQFPELKPLIRVAVRLHPRFSDEPGNRESKLGGSFLWPDAEPWPGCPEFRMPMAAVLQLRIEDAPPQFPMRPNSDLFQLFWTPRPTKAGPPHVLGFWRRAEDIDVPGANAALAESADLGFVPVPCRLFPERLAEFPPWELMPEAMREKVDRSVYRPGVARGTKAGGWPRVSGTVPKCRTCVRPMDYLLTIDSCEWSGGDAVMWKPREDSDEEGFRRAAGLQFGSPDASVQISICRRCEHWPLRAMIV